MAKIVTLICKLAALGLTAYVAIIYIRTAGPKSFWSFFGIGMLGLMVSNFALSVDISKVLENVLKIKTGDNDK